MLDIPEYEKTVNEFLEADKKYTEAEDLFMSGEFLRALLQAGPNAAPIEELIYAFRSFTDQLKKLLDDRNAKFVTAKNAMRSAVQLGPSQWRGPDGRSTILEYGPFTASSVTRRFIDAESLMALAAEKGFDRELLSLKGIDKNGKEFHFVQRGYSADYEGVLSWLKQKGLFEVIDGIYDERETTPQVKGPKKLAFLGEKKDE